MESTKKQSENDELKECVTLQTVLRKQQNDFLRRQLRFKIEMERYIDHKLVSASEDEDVVFPICLDTNFYRSFKEFKQLVSFAVSAAKARGFKVKLGKSKKRKEYFVALYGWKSLFFKRVKFDYD